MTCPTHPPPHVPGTWPWRGRLPLSSTSFALILCKWVCFKRLWGHAASGEETQLPPAVNKNRVHSLLGPHGPVWVPVGPLWKRSCLAETFPLRFFFVALWDTTVILFQYKNQTQVLGLGVSACLLSHPTVYLFESFLFHHVCWYTHRYW